MFCSTTAKAVREAGLRLTAKLRFRCAFYGSRIRAFSERKSKKHAQENDKSGEKALIQ